MCGVMGIACSSIIKRSCSRGVLGNVQPPYLAHYPDQDSCRGPGMSSPQPKCLSPNCFMYVINLRLHLLS